MKKLNNSEIDKVSGGSNGLDVQYNYSTSKYEVVLSVKSFDKKKDAENWAINASRKGAVTALYEEDMKSKYGY